MNRSETYPYPSRPGMGNELLDLDTETVAPLSPAELEDVIRFEQQLYHIQLDPLTFPTAETYRQAKAAFNQPIQPFESVWEKKINSTSLGVNYFMTDAGRQALISSLSVDIGVFDSTELCAAALRQLNIREISSAVLDELSDASVGYDEKQLTDAFIANNFDGSILSYPSSVTLYKHPEVLVEKVRGYRNLKIYINHAINDLKNTTDENNPALKAKLLVADLYKHRLNIFLTDDYVTAYNLLHQYRSSNGALQSEIVAQLSDLLPAFSIDKDNNRIAYSLQRLDRFNEGVYRDEDGKLSWLSPPAALLAEQAAAGVVESETVERELYADIDPVKLESVKVSGEVYGKWMSYVLAYYGLLSEYQDWDSERTGPAADGKWQVVVNGKFKSNATNDKQRVEKVTPKPTSVANTVVTIDHELTHVQQNENKRAISEFEIFKRIGIDNPSDQKEAGGLWRGEVARGAILGKTKNDIDGTGYFKMLQVKSRGGKYGECVQVYFEDLRLRKPNDPIDELALMAVNRARRIYRSGGSVYALDDAYLTNTQPLNYLEQRLIYENLSEEQKKLLYIGGISIQNLVRFARVGLADISKIFIPDLRPWELLHDKVVEQLAAS